MNNLIKFSIFINEAEEMKQKYYIYTLTDPIDKEVKYVGKSKDTKDRLKRHMSNDHLKDSWTSKNKWLLWLRNQGLKPEIEILDEGDVDNIDDLEIYWIEQLKHWGYKLKNETIGGDGYDWTGRKHKDSSKDLQKMNHPFRVPINQYEIETDKLIKEWDSSREIERETGIYRRHIIKCCKGIENFNSVKGFYWRFKDEYFPYKKSGLEKIKIEQYDIEGNLIKIFNSTYGLKKELNIDYRMIIKNNYEYKGFKWIIKKINN